MFGTKKSDILEMSAKYCEYSDVVGGLGEAVVKMTIYW